MVLQVINQSILKKSEILNIQGRHNCCIGLKVTAILVNGWILPTGAVASGRVCAYSLRSRLVLWCCTPKKWQCPELVNQKLTRVVGVTSPRFSNFRGWPVQDSVCVFFWTPARREIWGWKEGWCTLHMPVLVVVLHFGPQCYLQNAFKTHQETASLLDTKKITLSDLLAKCPFSFWKKNKNKSFKGFRELILKRISCNVSNHHTN